MNPARPRPLARLGLAVVPWLLAAGCATAVPGPATTPPSPVPAANLILATQAIGGPYQFTDAPYLLEVAREIESMGSTFLKFAAGPNYAGEPYRMERVPGIASLKDLLALHPVYVEVLGMPFTTYHFWAIPFAETEWQDGIDADEERALHAEMRDLAVHLLTRYRGTGKSFYLGNWEGDWMLLGSMDRTRDPTPERIAGFIQYLAIRQRAVDEARRTTPHEGVAVYHYAEVNLVRKGLDGTRPTLANAVLPHVDVDFVSYSAYDAQFGGDARAMLHESLDYLESKMVPRPGFAGKRVFVGEFGIKASTFDFDPVLHERENRRVARAIIEWGCPFAVYWQVYCNEPNPVRSQGYEGFWLIDAGGNRLPLHATFRDYWKAASAHAAAIAERTGSPATHDDLRRFALDALADP